LAYFYFYKNYFYEIKFQYFLGYYGSDTINDCLRNIYHFSINKAFLGTQSSDLENESEIIAIHVLIETLLRFAEVVFLVNFCADSIKVSIHSK